MSKAPLQWLVSTHGSARASILLFGWLFSVDQALPAENHPNYRRAELRLDARGKTGFTPMPGTQTGVQFTNDVSNALLLQNRLLEDGAGVAAGDMDGDGWCDLYFCRTQGPNVLYRNLGSWRFEDVTHKAKVACDRQHSTGAVFADADGDGDLDLLVGALGQGVRLFLNDGKGVFHEDLESGLVRKFGSRSLALADIDGDGDLDLYVTNYRATTVKDSPIRIQLTHSKAGFLVPPEHRNNFTVGITPDQKPVLIELGEPDVLYRNVGPGRFEPVEWTGGAFLDEEGNRLTAAPRDWGLAAMFRDINGDGAPDLYVCNDFYSPDRIWINDGKGQSRALQLTALRKTSWASMAVDFADINRDGLDDFFVADMLPVAHRDRHVQRANFETEALPAFGWGWTTGEVDKRTQVMRNTLFLNRGANDFAEIAQLSGVHASDWTWGAAFLDVDLDGYEDLLVANGHGHDHLNSDVHAKISTPGGQFDPSNRPKIFHLFPSLEVCKRAFRNRGALAFEDKSAEWGFDWKGISNGMAMADLDNDGDLDVILNNLNAPAALLRNDTSAPRVMVRLRGDPPNTQGIGAKIRLFGGGLVAQSQEIICGGRYLSGDDPARVFAASDRPMRIEVTWRSGKQTVVHQARANHIYEIYETHAAVAPAQSSVASRQSSVVSNQPSGAANLRNNRPPTTDHRQLTTDKLPFFEDVSHLLKASHHEVEFDDYQRQPLLPRKLSQNGPGVCWSDLNGDGRDDLVMASGMGGRLRVWLNKGQEGFSAVSTPVLEKAAAGDQTTILSWMNEPGKTLLLVATSGYEASLPLNESVSGFAVSFEGIAHQFGLNPGPNVGPMAAADIDGDGDLDLFAGGQAMPGRYPMPTRSVLYRQTQGNFLEDAENTKRLANLGLVNGAVWSDLDGDGTSELVLACEWGSIRVFRLTRDLLIETTGQLGLDNYTGLWTGVTTGDLNGDGRLDIVAANWGRNTKYQQFLNDKLRLYYGDLDGNGTWEVIEAHYEPTMKKEVPWRDYRLMGLAYPILKQRFQTYASYGSASVQEIFGEDLKKAQRLQASTLELMVFWNRGNRFQGQSLPLLAQLTPAFAVCIGDYDGDGNEDVFLSQNFFALDRETGRYDAGRALWLRGDGQGQVAPVPAIESGIKVFGEQRGAALADFDADGRVDLVVSQNAAPLKLFRNQQAKPGLRVRLLGPVGNINGFGAQTRLNYGNEFGPVREIHGGSGYWSQDSAVQVLGKRKMPTGIWVRWPGGKEMCLDLPPGAFEVEINQQGVLRVVR